ncbi:pyridoxal kinase [Cutibacterium acnes JCM 18920]|nr:pyridoxal kinase [Cutibacterium acnes JCM 18920]
MSLMTDAVQHADVVVPNLAELGILTGTEPRTLDDIVRAARSLTGPHLVIVTSVPYHDDGGDGIAMVGVTGEGAVLTHGPLFDRYFNGAGDLTSAVLTAVGERGATGCHAR